MKKLLIFLFSLFITMNGVLSQDECRLIRFPAIHENQVVFTYAGDLYSVERNGGLARKLTNHVGFEMFARFSPDGKTIAFTGQYDGNTEVYKMPAEGGVPERITYTATLGRDDVSDRMGPNNIVMTWTKDGENILYRSRRYSFNSFRGQLFLASVKGGLSSEIPLHNGGWCSYSPDGKKLAFNRVFREFRTWKYYTGGMTDDVWIYDFKTRKIENITNHPSQDIFPMWHKNEIYFLSDRDRRMNLFVYNTETKEVKKLTNFEDFDIKFPSIGGDDIIFENGGNIYIFNIPSQTTKKISIRVINDFSSCRNEIKSVTNLIRTVTPSPNGERVAISARGDIFSVPAKSGITRNLTKSSGAHDRNPSWSPDGKYIAYISDKSGEFEIYIQKQDATEEPVQLTKNADTYKYTIKWSPDSKKILWSDKKLRLRYIDIKTKKITEVDQSVCWEIRSYNWSSDSKWITYAKPEYETMSKIYIYNLSTKNSNAITDGWYEVDSPSFSEDGKYLLFSSDRTFKPTYSHTEWNHVYTSMEKIYLIMLAKDTPSPFAPENDEVKIKEEEKEEDEDKKEEDEDKKEEDIVIDLEGIKDRIIELPVSRSRYRNINCINDKVYYAQGSKIKMYDLKTKKETELAKGMEFSLTANKKKMMVTKKKEYSIINLPTSAIKTDEKINLSRLKVMVDYEQEWKQIYYESWRQMRDFFFAPNMHGVDWEAMRDKYAALLPYVKHRDDLTYVIGELIAELNIGHCYTQSGQKPRAEKIKMGLLGAKVSRHSSGYYQIDEILEGANWNVSLRSPLTEIGVDVNEGDYIIAIDGLPVNELENIYEALIDKAGKQVELTINSKPDEAGSRKTIIIPISDESNLYYYNWVQHNIEKVNKATNGQVGYIHIPDMSSNGLNEFIEHFYPQITKKGLIIDDRGNGGGNVSPMIIERLNREMIFSDVARNQKQGSANPSGTFVGPKVLLIDNYSASDGDLFPARFKALNMGKVIGMRSWGAITGIRGSLPFVDGGSLNKPEFAKYSVDGKEWPIEGHGVDPDIEIDNNPALEYKGVDQQLDKAIEVIIEEIEQFDKYIKPVPRYPDKTK